LLRFAQLTNTSASLIQNKGFANLNQDRIVTLQNQFNPERAIYGRRSSIMSILISELIGPGTDDEQVLALEVSDESLEQVANPERVGAVTLSFCSGLQVCPG
jgi:hypothetical protein